MARAVDEIKAEYGLTDFSAKELLDASKKLSKSYEDLARAYRTSLLTETKQLVQRNQEHERTKRDSSLWKKAAHAVDRLSGDAKRMWATYAEAVKARNHFTAVCRAHHLPPSWDRVITRTFEIRQATNDFSLGGEPVVNGRNAFDTLRREGYIAVHLSAHRITREIPHVEA